MIINSPAWLAGILPWGVVTVLLLKTRASSINISFLRLWQNRAAQPFKTKGRRLPPIWLIFALAGLLISILAAMEPGFSGALTQQEISIVLDRGISSVDDSVSGGRFRGMVTKAAAYLGGLPHETNVVLIPQPGVSEKLSAGTWYPEANAMSSIPLRVDLNQAITKQLKNTDGPVYVLSNQSLSVTSNRIVQFSPDPIGQRVAITELGAREFPRSCVMVRLRNESDRKSVRLSVTSGSSNRIQNCLLPPSGKSQIYFFDFDHLADTVSAQVEGDVESPWCKAWLARQRLSVPIIVNPTMSASVQKMVDIYARRHNPGHGAIPVLITKTPLTDEQCGLSIIENEPVKNLTQINSIVPHPITENVATWPRPAIASEVSTQARILVSASSQPILAVREQPSRQVWLYASLQKWEGTKDFVIFFANAMTWLQGGKEQYASQLAGRLPSDFKAVDADSIRRSVYAGEWPGIYQNKSGQLIAINAGEVPESTSHAEVSGLAKLMLYKTTFSLQARFVFVALIFLNLAAGAYPKGPRSQSSKGQKGATS